MIPNAMLRMKARQALKPVLPIILLCALVANLPSLATQTVTILTGSNPLSYLLSQVSTVSELSELMMDEARLTAVLQGYAADGRHILSIALSVLSWLLSPVLTLGLTWCLLELLRGHTIGVGSVFGRMSCFFKSIGLNLLTALKLVLWGLPGAGVMLLSMLFLFLPDSGTATWLLTVGYMVGMVLMIVLMLRAMLHYSIATIYLADDPELGVRGALRASIAMMRRRKMLLFSLMMTFVLWLMLLSLLTDLISAMLGMVIASTLSMLLQLMIHVYMQTSICAFYEAYRKQPDMHLP
ncbi:MAG: DUF975 family protein [Aristaeellaceae bacterium]